MVKLPEFVFKASHSPSLSVVPSEAETDETNLINTIIEEGNVP